MWSAQPPGRSVCDFIDFIVSPIRLTQRERSVVFVKEKSYHYCCFMKTNRLLCEMMGGMRQSVTWVISYYWLDDSQFSETDIKSKTMESIEWKVRKLPKWKATWRTVEKLDLVKSLKKKKIELKDRGNQRSFSIYLAEISRF